MYEVFEKNKVRVVKSRTNSTEIPGGALWKCAQVELFDNISFWIQRQHEKEAPQIVIIYINSTADGRASIGSTKEKTYTCAHLCLLHRNEQHNFLLRQLLQDEVLQCFFDGLVRLCGGRRLCATNWSPCPCSRRI